MSSSDTALDFLATTFNFGGDEKFILTEVEADLVRMGKGSASLLMVEAFPFSCSFNNCLKVDSGGVIFSLLFSTESC